MFYLKINDQIKQLIDLLNDRHIGCKYFCRLQLIALDEFDYLRRELENKQLRIITNEEFEEIKKSSEKMYFYNTHVCKAEETDAADINEEEEDELEELARDRVNKRKKDVFETKIDYEYLAKKKEEEGMNTIIKKDENSIAYAFNLVGSFFLIVFGSYYFGKYLLGLNDRNNYIIVLVVSIIVFIAEAILLIIRLHKDSNRMSNKTRDNSFAYRFNRKYRGNFVKSKVNEKTKTD
jgi:hypothetical protein